MSADVVAQPPRAIVPLGNRMTAADLPSRSTVRWTAIRKAEVVAAVNARLLSVEEACERYALSLEELVAWQRAEERSGVAGLRLTYVQRYRDQWERQS